MKYTMEKRIEDDIHDIEFLNVVGEKFKSKNANYLSLLRKTTYVGVGGVCEHVMKMVNWYNKLKSIKVDLGKDFLIWKVLNLFYLSLNVEWSIDEMISILTQDEGVMRKGKSDSVQFVSYNDNNKKKKFFKFKDTIYVPFMRRNLISSFVLDNCGYSFHFKNKRSTLSYDSVVVGFSILHDSLENLVVNYMVGYKHNKVTENSS
ncbi:hypothetical protein CR513_09133, partial [Mucuna pruriens]